MTYFRTKALGATIDSSRFGTTAAAVDQTVGSEQAAAFAKLKAEWPRCSVTVRDARTGTTSKVQGYLYKFPDGRSYCTPAWNQDYYAMLVQGQSPGIAALDLSKVRPGTAEYFTWLCRAQGNPEVQAAFERAGLAWQPTQDDQGRTMKPPYSERAHPQVSPLAIPACASYVKSQGGNEGSWKSRAYIYSVEHATAEASTRPGDLPGTTEHRASQCQYRVPPEYVAACEAALSKGDGTSIESFLDQLSRLNDEQRRALVSSKGLSPVVIYGGIAAGAVVLALLLKKRGSR